jgi:hypothetical protein
MDEILPPFPGKSSSPMLKKLGQFARAVRAAFGRDACNSSVRVGNEPREHFTRGEDDEDPMLAFKDRIVEIERRCVQLASALAETNVARALYLARHAAARWFTARDAYRAFGKPSPLRAAARRSLEASRLLLLRQLARAVEVVDGLEPRSGLPQVRDRLAGAEIDDTTTTEARP